MATTFALIFNLYDFLHFIIVATEKLPWFSFIYISVWFVENGDICSKADVTLAFQRLA